MTAAGIGRSAVDSSRGRRPTGKSEEPRSSGDETTGAPTRSGRDLADLAQQLLGELPALRVVNLEGPFGGLDQRPSDAAYAEGRRQLAQLADLGGEGFRSHACDGT